MTRVCLRRFCNLQCQETDSQNTYDTNVQEF